MATKVLYATKDTDIRNQTATTPYGATELMWVGELNTQTNDIRRLLIDFNLLEEIPKGSVINSVILSMYYDGTEQASSNRTFQAYRVIRPWVESEVTWNIAKSGTNWGTAGCANQSTDYDASVSLGAVQRNDGASAAWIHDSLTASEFQKIVDDQLTFEGILIRRNPGIGDESDDAFRHRTRENTTSPGSPAWAPYLTIDYTPPGAEFAVVII